MVGQQHQKEGLKPHLHKRKYFHSSHYTSEGCGGEPNNCIWKCTENNHQLCNISIKARELACDGTSTLVNNN